MVDIIKYTYKIVRLKNLLKVGLENLCIKYLGNSIYDGCLKKKNNVRYATFVLEKKNETNI